MALVTGAGCIGPGWGNGRATAVLFAREGAKVFAVDKNGESMKETLDRVAEFGGTIKTHECDVTQSASVKAMIDACLAAFGRIDVLVNNVGGSAAGGPVELSEEAWDGQMNYNLKSVFLACKHVLPIMERQGGGAIVNLASTSGLRWTGSPQVGYAASKAGVMQLSRVVAVQYANKGIRVNTVVPGQLHTPMVEARLARQRAGGDVEKLLKTRVDAHSGGLHGRRPRHRQRRAVPRLRRGAVRHRHRDHRRRRHGGALRLTLIALTPGAFFAIRRHAILAKMPPKAGIRAKARLASKRQGLRNCQTINSEAAAKICDC